jgi:glutathione S-transferase
VIDFYYWPTPNGWKVAIMLEECGLGYRVIPVNIGRGDQFKPEFLAISPNNRMPAIVDHDDGEGPLPVFESGAILIHLAERTGRYMSQSRRGRKETLEWLFWQVGNLGPMAGQLSHFVNNAKGEHPYSHKRYADEYNRCLGVLERRLDGREYIVDRLFDRRHGVMAMGADCEAARPAARRFSQCRPMARGTQGSAGGAARGGFGQGIAPLGAAFRRGTARTV